MNTRKLRMVGSLAVFSLLGVSASFGQYRSLRYERALSDDDYSHLELGQDPEGSQGHPGPDRTRDREPKTDWPGLVDSILDGVGGIKGRPHPGRGSGESGGRRRWPREEIRVPDRVYDYPPIGRWPRPGRIPTVVPMPVNPRPPVVRPNPIVERPPSAPVNKLPVVNKPAAPPANPTPPKPILSLTSNEHAMPPFGKLSERGLYSGGNFIKKETEKTIDELEEEIGSDDPAVKSLFEEARNAQKEGKTLDPTWGERLDKALKESQEKSRTDATNGVDEVGKNIDGAGAETKKVLDAAKEKIGKGEELGPDFKKDLDKAIAADGAKIDPKRKDELTAKTEELGKKNAKATESAKKAKGGKASELAKDLPGLLKANSVWKDALDKKNSPSPIPSGPVMVVVFPHLPPGKVYMLPGGSLMTGTGGMGNIDAIVADPADYLGMPVGAGMPVPDSSDGALRPVAEGVLLRNPAENGAAVGYLIDSRWTYTLESDYVHHLEGEPNRAIRFSRGGAGSEASYQLSEGTYRFAASDKGWDLHRESFDVTIDNTASDSDFYCVVDERQVKVLAGGHRTHRSRYPIVVRFNRGMPGEEAVKRVTEANDRLTVAINPLDGMIDLYRMNLAMGGPSAIAADELPIGGPSAPQAPSAPRPETKLVSAEPTPGRL